MKKLAALLLIAAMTLSLAACGGGDGAEKGSNSQNDAQSSSEGDKGEDGQEAKDQGDTGKEDGEDTKGEPYKAAFLVNGNLGDKSFYDSANEGLVRLKEELGADVFDYKVEEMGGEVSDEGNWEPTLLDYCDTGEYDVIITGTWQMYEALATACEMYPDQKFIFFDERFDFEAEGNPDNVFNMLFKQNEVSYLVGAGAALMTASSEVEGVDPTKNIIGFLGGMSDVLVNDFLVGYIQGAKDVNPDIQIAIAYVGDYLDSAKGKDLSLAQFQSGSDVGFNVAGDAGLGLLEAASESGKYAFGVDSDQAALLPDYAASIPTSALKNIGNALYLAIQEDMEGKLAYGTTKSYSFAEGGVGLVMDAHYEEMVPESIRTKLAELQEGIINGDIVVNSSYTMTPEEIEAEIESVKLK